MKTISNLFTKRIAITILVMTSVLLGCKQSGTESDGLITVDVNKNYPKKELILQDFMDVEYIPLETNDEFICQGQVLAVGKNIIIVRNHRADGDIFIFDRSGKALRKINRKGQSGEEYIYVLNLVLDEKNDEIFVNDMDSKKIIVYDLMGNFKRSFRHKEGIWYDEFYNLNDENLICHDGLDDSSTSLTLKNTGQSFFVISKKDGSVTNEIQIPFEQKKSIVMKFRDEEAQWTSAYMPPSYFPIVPNFENYILTEISADTIYSYSSDNIMKPLITRTPSVQSMNPEKFLLMSFVTDRYYFMESIEKTMDFTAANLVYDKQEKEIYKYTVYNGDYTVKEDLYMKSRSINIEQSRKNSFRLKIVDQIVFQISSIIVEVERTDIIRIFIAVYKKYIAEGLSFQPSC